MLVPTPSNHILSRESTGQRQKLPFPHSRCGTPTGRPTGLTTPSPSGLVRQRQTTLFRDQRHVVLSAHGISTRLSGEKWGMENSLFSLTEPPPTCVHSTHKRLNRAPLPRHGAPLPHKRPCLTRGNRHHQQHGRMHLCRQGLMSFRFPTCLATRG